MGDRLSAYRDALDYLFVRTTGQWKFGLERTVALLEALGNPQHDLRIVHVGGTNGKGSVCATMERVLLDRGFRVAKYTSPHLVDFRERVLIDGRPIDEGAVVAFIEEWTPTIERLGATFFEATTAMAFHLFARAKPDIAIVEVGLGGRLDATNVVSSLLAVVTGIGIDHTEYLGETRPEIAYEKAGIFKPATPALIGEADPTIRALLAQHARAAGAAPVYMLDDLMRADDVHIGPEGTSFVLRHRDVDRLSCNTSMLGRHQARNAIVALAALEMLVPPFATPVAQACRSLGRVTLAGRFQRDGRYIFDVAHNRDGAAVCAATLASLAPPPPCVALLSVLGDKDWAGMMEELAACVDEFVLTTAPTSPAERAWDPAVALQFAETRGWKAILEPDFDRALARAVDRGITVLISGSFHTVGDAMLRLHVSPLPS